MATCLDGFDPKDSTDPNEKPVLCGPAHCAQLQLTSMFRRVCKCIDARGNPIPNCTPRDHHYPVPSGACQNSETGEWDETVGSDDCYARGGPWHWKTCYCCCPQPCFDALPYLAPNAVACTADHCSQFEQTAAFNAICKCIDPYGNPIPDCTPKDARYPVPLFQCWNSRTGQVVDDQPDACAARGPDWQLQTCYCCCSCFAAATPIGVPGGFRRIGDLAVGDRILTATKTAEGWTWTAETLQFSVGSPAQVEAGGNLMLEVEYGAGRSLVAPPSQLFMVTGGKLKRADQLVPGHDRLVSEQGEPVDIARVRTGMYYRAIHHIATEVTPYSAFSGSLDRHLINLNGVICGDYMLQLYQNAPKMAANMADPAAPALGSAAYAARHGDLHVAPHVAAVSRRAAPEAAAGFRPHGPSTFVVPQDAACLFGPAQERLLAGSRMPKRAFSDNVNMEMVDYYATLYGAFYPGIRFHSDWESQRPNVFAFEQAGQRHVMIAGALMRLVPLHGEAMAIALAFGVGGHFGGGADKQHALEFGVGVVMRRALQGVAAWTDVVLAGRQQIAALLALVPRQALRRPDREHPSLQQLLDTIAAVAAGRALHGAASSPPFAPRAPARRRKHQQQTGARR